MTDITKRDAVLKMFEEPGYDPVAWIQRQRMADRIVELEAAVERQDRILASLRGRRAAVRAVEDWIGPSYTSHAQHTIRADRCSGTGGGPVICTTLNAIRAHNPCGDGWAKLLAHLGKTGPDDEPLPLVTILDSNGLDDALWALRAVTGEDARIRRYAVWCARQVQHLMTDSRSLAALDVAERHADGLATDDELAKAQAAAWDAARAGAWAGAWAAAAARDGAWAAAWTAAGAAMRERQEAEFRRVFGDEEGTP